jgi:DNA polymerase-3 subunit epsilon
MEPMQNDQLGFEFLPDLPVAEPADVKPKRVRRAAPEAAVPAVTEDPHILAQRLEANPDYRVLRRLKERLDWGSAAAQDITRVVILDTETTGLDCSKEVIIELAMLCVDVDNQTGMPVGKVQVYDQLEDPGRPIPKEIIAITGITDDDVRGQRLDEALIATLLDGVDLVIAHNAGFDRPFVERRLPQFANLAWACSFADMDWKALGQGSAKLESLALAKGWFYDAHRAEVDCHALMAVLASPWDGLGCTALAHLVQAGKQPSFKLSATNAPFESKDALKSRGYRWNADQRVWQTRLGGTPQLASECTWLREHVYGQRNAVVQVETLDALARYSGRTGVVNHHQLKESP